MGQQSAPSLLRWRPMIEVGFVLLAVAVLLWFHTSIPRAAMACGDARSASHALRLRFMVAAVAWIAVREPLAAHASREPSRDGAEARDQRNFSGALDPFACPHSPSPA